MSFVTSRVSSIIKLNKTLSGLFTHDHSTIQYNISNYKTDLSNGFSVNLLSLNISTINVDILSNIYSYLSIINDFRRYLYLVLIRLAYLIYLFILI